jgi:hypothetical protein
MLGGNLGEAREEPGQEARKKSEPQPIEPALNPTCRARACGTWGAYCGVHSAAAPRHIACANNAHIHLIRALCNPPKQRPVRTLAAEFTEHAVRPLQQRSRRIKLDYLPVAEHKHAVVVNHGLEPVRNANDLSVREIATNRLLDLREASFH